jgi:hemolysin type calcium-binding protein
MYSVRAPRHGRRLAVTLATASALSMLAAAAAQPAHAQILVPVPPGCGAYSGTMVPANQLDDHSNDGAPLGTFGVGPAGFFDLPYQVPLVAGIIVVGTTGFTDNIQGNVFDNIICLRGGDDWARGGFGSDEIFGGAGADSLWGEEDGDVIHGGQDRDTLHGDDPGNSHGNFDLVDEIYGGQDDDWMSGGAGGDDFTGGLDLNVGDEVFDFDPAADSCTGVEIGC